MLKKKGPASRPSPPATWAKSEVPHAGLSWIYSYLAMEANNATAAATSLTAVDVG
jgi:hypothetical protein